MDNNFEDNLKNLIKTNIQIPDDVNSKIQNAYAELNTPKKKTNVQKITSIAASITLVAVLGGNVLAYSQNKPNIFSWVLQAFNIETEYNNNSQPINQTVKNPGATITVTDVGLDKNLLIVGYHITTDKTLNTPFILSGEKRIIADDLNINVFYASLHEQLHNQVFTKISDNEYILYEMYNIATYQLPENFTFIANIKSLDNYTNQPIAEYYQLGDTVSGEWNFKLDISKANSALTSTEYYIDDFSITLDNGEVVELVNTKVSNIATILTFYQTIPSMDIYTVELLDTAGNIILPKNLQTLSGGISEVLSKALSVNDTVKINIYKYGIGSNGLLAKGSADFILSKHGKIAVENKFAYSDTRFNDITVTIPDTWEVHDYDTTMIIDIYRQINSKRNIQESDIGLITYNLENDFKKKYTLEELKDILETCLSLDYILTDEFTIHFDNTNEECILTYNEVVDLISGKITSITKNGRTFGKDALHSVEGFKILSTDKVKIGSIDAYKIISSSDYQDTKETYLFVYKGKVYVINVPLSSYFISEIEDIIKNISFE